MDTTQPQGLYSKLYQSLLSLIARKLELQQNQSLIQLMIWAKVLRGWLQVQHGTLVLLSAIAKLYFL